MWGFVKNVVSLGGHARLEKVLRRLLKRASLEDPVVTMDPSEA